MCDILSATVTEGLCGINTVIVKFCPVILQCVGTRQKFRLYPCAECISHVWCHVVPYLARMVHSKNTDVNVGQCGLCRCIREESFFPVVLYGFLHEVLPSGWRNGSIKYIMDLRETLPAICTQYQDLE